MKYFLTYRGGNAVYWQEIVLKLLINEKKEFLEKIAIKRPLCAMKSSLMEPDRIPPTKLEYIL
jgi:hypothetical protein